MGVLHDKRKPHPKGLLSERKREKGRVMTTVKDAIAVFATNEERNPELKPVDECEVVKLYFMKPPMNKLDPAALSVLKECKHLALSTNAIDKMVNFGALEKLEILSLGRNNIKKIEHLDAISDHLQELWLSYNNISSLAGLEKCSVLHTLYVGNNKIADVKEVQRLLTMPALENVVLYGNPLHKKIIDDGDLAWPEKMLKTLPNIKKLDGIAVIQWKLMISEGNEKQLRWLFDQIDADKSGDLDLQEMRAAFKDDDLRREMGVPKDKCEEVFSKMDDDSSGSIKWEEFREYFCTTTDLAGLL